MKRRTKHQLVGVGLVMLTAAMLVNLGVISEVAGFSIFLGAGLIAYVASLAWAVSELIRRNRRT